jgi:hypothetical protein
MRSVVLGCVVVLVAWPGMASAQSTSDDHLVQTRQAIDATADRWFHAQHEVAALDGRIAELERDIHRAEGRLSSAREVATERALLMYKGASLEYGSVFGTTIVESARRATYIDKADARNLAAIDALSASVKDLKTQRTALVASREKHDEALQAVASQRERLDAQLASLRDESQQAAHAATAGTTVGERLPRLDSIPADALAPATGPPRVVSALLARSARPRGGILSPHHNDPFLVCTRARESGGDYGLVSAGGTYYGAYQFSPSTWNVTAAHVGRLDIVGVSPSRASAYDQDEMAWGLYQWQGKAPWGDGC